MIPPVLPTKQMKKLYLPNISLKESTYYNGWKFKSLETESLIHELNFSSLVINKILKLESMILECMFVL